MSLRNDLIRLAYSKPDIRKNVLPLVRTAARRQFLESKRILPHPSERKEWQAFDNYLEVTLWKSGDSFDISVWGQDDTGMEIEGLDGLKARSLYELITNKMTFQTFRAFGFQSA